MTSRRRPSSLVVVEPAAASRLPGDEGLPLDPAVAAASIEWTGPRRGFVRPAHGDVRRFAVGADRPADASGSRRLEVVVGGWRFELEVEEVRRRELRERARRDHGTAAGGGGPLEIHAIIPGRIAAVAVSPGDVVAVGQTLLLVEAMKMQNELRAPRDGTVGRVAVGVGDTIDLGDLLVVLE
jgi:biotin carboxyl carrier protein